MEVACGEPGQPSEQQTTQQLQAATAAPTLAASVRAIHPLQDCDTSNDMLADGQQNATTTTSAVAEAAGRVHPAPRTNMLLPADDEGPLLHGPVTAAVVSPASPVCESHTAGDTHLHAAPLQDTACAALPTDAQHTALTATAAGGPASPGFKGQQQQQRQTVPSYCPTQKGSTGSSNGSHNPSPWMKANPASPDNATLLVTPVITTTAAPAAGCGMWHQQQQQHNDMQRRITGDAAQSQLSQAIGGSIMQMQQQQGRNQFGIPAQFQGFEAAAAATPASQQYQHQHQQQQQQRGVTGLVPSPPSSGVTAHASSASAFTMQRALPGSTTPAGPVAGSQTMYHHPGSNLGLVDAKHQGLTQVHTGQRPTLDSTPAAAAAAGGPMFRQQVSDPAGYSVAVQRGNLYYQSSNIGYRSHEFQQQQQQHMHERSMRQQQQQVYPLPSYQPTVMTAAAAAPGGSSDMHDLSDHYYTLAQQQQMLREKLSSLEQQEKLLMMQQQQRQHASTAAVPQAPAVAVAAAAGQQFDPQMLAAWQSFTSDCDAEIDHHQMPPVRVTSERQAGTPAAQPTPLQQQQLEQGHAPATVATEAVAAQPGAVQPAVAARIDSDADVTPRRDQQHCKRRQHYDLVMESPGMVDSSGGSSDTSSSNKHQVAKVVAQMVDTVVAMSMGGGSTAELDPPGMVDITAAAVANSSAAHNQAASQQDEELTSSGDNGDADLPLHVSGWADGSRSLGQQQQQQQQRDQQVQPGSATGAAGITSAAVADSYSPMIPPNRNKHPRAISEGITAAAAAGHGSCSDMALNEAAFAAGISTAGASLEGGGQGMARLAAPAASEGTNCTKMQGAASVPGQAACLLDMLDDFGDDLAPGGIMLEDLLDFSSPARGGTGPAGAAGGREPTQQQQQQQRVSAPGSAACGGVGNSHHNSSWHASTPTAVQHQQRQAFGGCASPGAAAGMHRGATVGVAQQSALMQHRSLPISSQHGSWHQAQGRPTVTTAANVQGLHCSSSPHIVSTYQQQHSVMSAQRQHHVMPGHHTSLEQSDVAAAGHAFHGYHPYQQQQHAVHQSRYAAADGRGMYGHSARVHGMGSCPPDMPGTAAAAVGSCIPRQQQQHLVPNYALQPVGLGNYQPPPQLRQQSDVSAVQYHRLDGSVYDPHSDSRVVGMYERQQLLVDQHQASSAAPPHGVQGMKQTSYRHSNHIDVDPSLSYNYSHIYHQGRSVVTSQNPGQLMHHQQQHMQQQQPRLPGSPFGKAQAQCAQFESFGLPGLTGRLSGPDDLGQPSHPSLAPGHLMSGLQSAQFSGPGGHNQPGHPNLAGGFSAHHPSGPFDHSQPGPASLAAYQQSGRMSGPGHLGQPGMPGQPYSAGLSGLDMHSHPAPPGLDQSSLGPSVTHTGYGLSYPERSDSHHAMFQQQQQQQHIHGALHRVGSAPIMPTALGVQPSGLVGHSAPLGYSPSVPAVGYNSSNPDLRSAAFGTSHPGPEPQHQLAPPGPCGATRNQGFGHSTAAFSENNLSEQTQQAAPAAAGGAQSQVKVKVKVQVQPVKRGRGRPPSRARLAAKEVELVPVVEPVVEQPHMAPAMPEPTWHERQEMQRAAQLQFMQQQQHMQPVPHTQHPSMHMQPGYNGSSGVLNTGAGGVGVPGFSMEMASGSGFASGGDCTSLSGGISSASQQQQGLLQRKRSGNISGLMDTLKPSKSFKLELSPSESKSSEKSPNSASSNSNSTGSGGSFPKKKSGGMPMPVIRNGVMIPPPAGPEMAARGKPTFADLVQGGAFPPGTYEFSVGTVQSVVASVSSNGTITYAEEQYQSISSFALAAARSRNPNRQACDGWKEVRLQGKKLELWRLAFLNKESPPPIPDGCQQDAYCFGSNMSLS